MNMPATTNLHEIQTVSAASLIMNSESFDRVMVLAEIMSSGIATVPKHLHGNKSDCAAVAMQALQWGMNPYSVAQKTHLVNGTLGYEAQLVNAVIQSSGAITGRPHYEYHGEGAALACRVGCVVSGEEVITWTEWLKSSDVTTKNSPLWKTNPKQQMGYLQLKNWARLYTPGAILGIYTADELQEIPEREVNPAAEQKEADIKYYPAEAFEKNFAKWKSAIETGKSTHEDWIATLSNKGELTKEQLARINAVKAPIEGEVQS